MLVRIGEMRKLSWSPFPIAQVETPIGRTAVPWRGAPDAPPGRYHVEWTVDAEITWGLDAEPAPESTPAILAGGHCVILRGLLRLTPDGAGALDLHGSLILLDFAEPPPPDADGAWIRVRVSPADVHLYPYEL